MAFYRMVLFVNIIREADGDSHLVPFEAMTYFRSHSVSCPCFNGV